MVNQLKALVCLFVLGCCVGAWPSSGHVYPTYQGPCDIVACAEAYSVTRDMTVNYTGALFQIYNGSSTKDIGTVNHKADMSTWSTFCSGVQQNCLVTKIYPQIHAANVLVPATDAGINGGPNCSASNTTCASEFTIDAKSLLPILTTTSSPSPSEYYIGTPGSDDTQSTGITAGIEALSVVLDGQTVEKHFCCGVFGMAHKWNAGDTVGTDFLVSLAWGQNSPESNLTNCATTSTFCAGVEEESANDMADYGSTICSTCIVGASYNPVGSTTVIGYLNGSQIFSNSPPAGNPLNVGKFVHLGGGGDLGQIAEIAMREALITNSTLTAGQQAAVYNNMNAFYSSISPGYVGIGDLVGGAASYLGVRAYSKATIGTAAINIIRASDSHTCDILLASNGGLGNTANCSTGGDDGEAVATWCTSTTCSLTEVYDQTGNGNSVTQSTAADRPTLTFNCVNTNLPCMTFNGSSDWMVASQCVATSGAISTGSFTERTGSFSGFNTDYSVCNTSSQTNGVGHPNSANTVWCNFDGTSGTQETANDNAWNSQTCVAGGDYLVDGNLLVNQSVDTISTGFNASLASGNNNGTGQFFFNGNITEVYAFKYNTTPASLTAICVNQRLYFGQTFSGPAC